MHSLEKHHIIDLYCVVSDLVPVRKGPGRPGLSKSEVVTILLWNALTENQYLLKDIHSWVKRHYRSEFPRFPHYSAFVDQCHACYPELYLVLQFLLKRDTSIRFLDSTMLPVCREHRSNSYKVARELTGLGKNHQGYFYGFKLHGAITQKGQFCALFLTGADLYDGHVSKGLVNEYTQVAVGDTHYGGKAQTAPLTKKYGTVFLAYPHPKQNKKLMAEWQKVLLNFRSKIESVWDWLKQHKHLVTSFPRSAMGYLIHYLPRLIAYQISVL